MSQVKAYAAFSSTEKLKPFEVPRRNLSENDVDIEIEYCGVCHSDIHYARNEWGGTKYPVVPGHEIVGVVRNIGSKVTKYKVGDVVGVGCMVDSCRQCRSCHEHDEQYCEKGFTGTYGGFDLKYNTLTYGGYSKSIVVDENYVLKIPLNLDLKSVAPLLCAGVTMWSPLSQWKVKKGDTVGIIGLGGLGHMGIKLANALGAKVVMITTSPKKGEDAKKLGASDVLISTNPLEIEKWANQFDLLINTIPVGHDINPYLGLLKKDATMVIVGAIEPLEKFHGGLIVRNRRRIAGSLIGGIKETQEMLDFCGKHNITSDVEMIRMEEINEAYERMIRSDVKYRFVIDIKSF